MGAKCDQVAKYALQIANNNVHGYSMENRCGTLASGDFDCSSFVTYVWHLVDPDVAAYGSTETMVSQMVGTGKFDILPSSTKPKKGDVVHSFGSERPSGIGHTELVYDDYGSLVGAHSNYDKKAGDSSGREISTDGGSASSYHRILRYNRDNIGVKKAYNSITGVTTQ